MSWFLIGLIFIFGLWISAHLAFRWLWSHGNWNTDYANANDAVPHAWNPVPQVKPHAVPSH